MLKHGGLALFAALLTAVSSHPCFIPGDTRYDEERLQKLVRNAEVIVRARAEGMAPEPSLQEIVAGLREQVRFGVLEVLKGSLPSDEIQFKGKLEDRNDRNPLPVPYASVRPGGLQGSCFAINYRKGAQYLLLLSRSGNEMFARPQDLTPYWALLAPTNEQLVFGVYDPWLLWVAQQLRESEMGQP